MGQKVAFATTNYSAQPERSSGFNGFPFPISYNGEVWDGTFEDLGGAIDTWEDFGGVSNNVWAEVGGYIPNYQPKKNNPNSILVGPGTSFAGPFTIDEAMAIFWRTKKWSIAANGQAGESFYATAYNTDSGPPDFIPQPYGPVPNECNGVTNSAFVSSLNAGDTIFYGDDPRYVAQEESELIFKSRYRSWSNEKSAGGGVSDCWPYYSWQASGILSVNFKISEYGPFFNVVVAQGTQDYYIQFEFVAEARTGDYLAAYRYWDGYANNAVRFLLVKPAGFVSTRRRKSYPFPNYPNQWGYVYSRHWVDFPQSGDHFEVPTAFEANYNTTSLSGIQAILNFKVPSSNRILEVPIYGYYYSLTYGDFTSRTIYTVTSSIASIQSVDISPVEYWEYDDGNGNSIYDKDTGAILRDPVTGEVQE